MRPQIGVDDALIVLNLICGTFSKQFAMGQTVDFVSHIHDDAHIVLNDEQCDPKLRVCAFQPVAVYKPSTSLAMMLR